MSAPTRSNNICAIYALSYMCSSHSEYLPVLTIPSELLRTIERNGITTDDMHSLIKSLDTSGHLQRLDFAGPGEDTRENATKTVTLLTSAKLPFLISYTVEGLFDLGYPSGHVVCVVNFDNDKLYYIDQDDRIKTMPKDELAFINFAYYFARDGGKMHNNYKIVSLKFNLL